MQKLQSNTTHDKYTNYEEQVVLDTNKHLRVIEEMIENQFEIICSNTNKTDTLVLLKELLDIFKTNFNAAEIYIFNEYEYVYFIRIQSLVYRKYQRQLYCLKKT